MCSVHGLRYLVEAKNPVIKTVWFITICFCVGSATAIIFLNVVNWSNSPAVVTSVHTDLAEVGGVLLQCLRMFLLK